MIQSIFYIIGGYLFFLVSFYFLSDSVLFQPPRPTSFVGEPFIYLPNEQAKYTILFSHGNAEDLGTLLPFLQEYHRQGFAIFAYDYPGYGTRLEKSTEQGTYDAIDQAYALLTQKHGIDPKHIILHGRSLGAAVSIDLATRVPSAGLILESPFLSAYRVYTQIPLFPFDKYNNLSKLSKIHVPTLVMHGLADNIIPFWQGEKIYQSLPGKKQFYAVKNAGHNNIFASDPALYWQTIERFVNEL